MRFVTTVLAGLAVLVPTHLSAQSEAVAQLGSLADPVGGWLAVLGIVAIGMLLSTDTLRVALAVGLGGFAIGALSPLSLFATPVWVFGLLGATFAFGSKDPGMLTRMAPIGVLAFAHGMGLATLGSYAIADVLFFGAGSLVLLVAGVVTGAYCGICDIALPDLRP
jgi:hypothetical protein